MQQHAQKDQEGKDDPVDCCLRAAVDVVDPGIECKQQQEGQVNPHLNASDGCHSVGPFHVRTMADGPLQASAFRGRAVRGALLTSTGCLNTLAGFMEVLKVLVADPVSQRGLDEIATGGELEVVVKTDMSEADLIKMIPEFSALVVRSQTKVTAAVLQAAKKLRVVGRAGVGVDNVDIQAATKRGVIVMNTPGGNTISTAEHAFSLLVSIARAIPQADASVRAGNGTANAMRAWNCITRPWGPWDGPGWNGDCARAIAFGMRVIAYDPYLSASRARSLQVELIEQIDSYRCDFLSLHMPLTEETHHILDERRLALCRKARADRQLRSRGPDR